MHDVGAEIAALPEGDDDARCVRGDPLQQVEEERHPAEGDDGAADPVSEGAAIERGQRRARRRQRHQHEIERRADTS